MSSVPSINAYAAVHTRHHNHRPTNAGKEESHPNQPAQPQNTSAVNATQSSSLPVPQHDEKAKSTLLGMFGNFIGKLNFAGHDGVFFGNQPNDESNKNVDHLAPPGETSILSRVRHLSSSSYTSADERSPCPSPSFLPEKKGND